MKHDTPRDVPAVRIEPAERASLSRLGQETLEALFEDWLELRLEQAAGLRTAADEQRKRDEQGAFLVGVVKAAAQPDDAGAPGLAERGALDDFLQNSRAQLDAAQAALETRVSSERVDLARRFATVKARVAERVRSFLERVRPKLLLRVHGLGSDRTVLQLDRLSLDDSHLVLFALSGRIATRYDFLFDDSTDDVAQGPSPLYPDEGVAPGEVRPTAAELEQVLRGREEIWPIKGQLPVWVSRSGGEDLFRLLQRGAVMEVEIRDGDGFRGALTRDESERFAGHLLRLRIAGRIELEVASA